MNDRVSRVTPDGRSARWSEHRVTRREELLDAAIEAITEHGGDVGMDQIATAAGTSKPAIYRYFADRGELYRAVGRRVSEQIVQTLQDVHESGTHTEDPRELLRRAIDGYLQLLDERPELFRFVTQHQLLPDVRAARATPAEHGDPIASILTRTLGEQLSRVGLDPVAAQPWGEAAVGFIRAAGLWWLDHPAAMTRPQLTEYLAALLWGGAAGVFRSAGVEVDARPRPDVFPTAPATPTGSGPSS